MSLYKLHAVLDISMLICQMLAVNSITKEFVNKFSIGELVTARKKEQFKSGFDMDAKQN